MRENYDEITSGSANNDYKVQFFNLKDGEKAIVRILVDSVNDMAPYTYHDLVTPEGAHKKIGCARTLREDLSKCPLCAEGNEALPISYIHMIQYYKNPDGSWRGEAKTWGKKPSKSDKSVIGMIRKALDEYGPLSDYISSISRTGTELNTTYSLNVNLPEKVYGPASNFPFDKNAFEGYSEDGTIIKNWSIQEMENYLNTGEFPVTASNSNDYSNFDANTARQAYTNTSNVVPNIDLPFNNDVTYSEPVAEAAPFNNARTVGNPVNYGATAQQTTVERPVRRYN